MVDKVKYIGVYFERKSGQCDISQAFIKFYSQFNNIVAVMGKNSNELTTLPIAVKFATCRIEVCISFMWHGITVSDILVDISRILETKCQVNTAVYLWIIAAVLLVGST